MWANSENMEVTNEAIGLTNTWKDIQTHLNLSKLPKRFKKLHQFFGTLLNRINQRKKLFHNRKDCLN